MLLPGRSVLPVLANPLPVLALARETPLQETFPGTSLVVQWLRLCTSTAGGMGSIPSWRAKIPHGKKNFPDFCHRHLDRIEGPPLLYPSTAPVFIGKTDAEDEAPILWPPNVKSWLIGKDPDAGRDWGQEEKGMTEDKMASPTQWT